MSYYICMSVIPKIVEQSDVVSVALEFCKDMLRQENIEEIIGCNIGWLPNYANLLHDKELAVWSFSDSDSEFLYSIFRYTFVYYKKYKMLCVIGDYSDYKQIIFQNSCDQDEDFNTWQALYADNPCRDIFKELVDRTISGENIAEIPNISMMLIGTAILMLNILNGGLYIRRSKMLFVLMMFYGMLTVRTFSNLSLEKDLL